jgi:hypothetical protein
MKTFIMFCGLLCIASIATAQQPVQFFGHEDHVKPSMTTAYFNFLKKTKEIYEKNQVNLTYSTFMQDDNTFYFFTPMQPMDIAGVYKGYSEASAKVGTDAIAKLWAEKGKYIDSHNEFVTALLPQFTYLAPAEGENFRHTMFWFPMDGMESEVDQIAKEWIELHQSKKSPDGYQSFKTVLGGEPGYVIVRWGKDEMDFYSKNKKGNELLGEEGAKLWSRTLAITKKVYRRNSWHLPDLSYSNKAPAMAK